MKDLKIKIQIGDQPIMVWEILYKEEKYTKFKASISAGKKQLDGTWINKSQSFNCFVFGEIKEKFDKEVQPRQRIKVWGNISMLPEKVQDPLNNFTTTLFSKAQINVDNFEIIKQETEEQQQASNNYFKTSKGF